MPLPWLIGVAVAAVAGAAIAAAVSDDDDSSSSSSHSDDVERQLREAVAKERRQREHTQKREAAKEDFQKHGSALGRNLAKMLPSDWVEASAANNFELEFDLKKGRLQFDMEKALLRSISLLETVSSLETILTKRASHQKIIDNLATFSELYKPEFQYHEKLRKLEERVIDLDEGINKLKEIRSQLIRLETEAKSTQAKGSSTL